ncbi:MAG: hypothetical protein M3N98_00120, partial [Actinomycetota bacterium]|nr:hypothetical protein [Actinomycetota bacterium]
MARTQPVDTLVLDPRADQAQPGGVDLRGLALTGAAAALALVRAAVEATTPTTTDSAIDNRPIVCLCRISHLRVADDP